MANPQLEDGYVAIAHDLYVAIDRTNFTTTERRVVSAVMFFTYGQGRKLAAITADDIRYYLTGDKRVRGDRVGQIITNLVDRRILVCQEGKLGIEKNFEKWLVKAEKPAQVDKLSAPLQDEYKYIYITTSRRGEDKLSTPGKRLTPAQRLVTYSTLTSHLKHSQASYRAELAMARKLYTALSRALGDPQEAFERLCDYIDQDDWMRQNVRFQFTYMSSRFANWLRQWPRKPRETAEVEQAMGIRYTYHVKSKRWQQALPHEVRDGK